MPTVSVIMPAFNSAAYIDAAIHSVLNQTVSDVELLVIDDGSADETAAIVARRGRRAADGGRSSAFTTSCPVRFARC